MWPVSPDYPSVIAGPHEIVRQADVLVGTQVAYRGLPVTGGTITVSASQRVRRQCNLTITPTLPISTYEVIPALAAAATGLDADHPLRWTGPQIRVQHGVRFPSGNIEWVPVGVFRIDGALGSLLQDEPVQVVGASRESWLIDDNRRGGAFTTTGGTATSLIRQVILTSAPGAEVLIATRQDRIVPASSADDSDAWATVERLARSIGCVAYCDADGRFIVADQPTKDSAAVTLIKPGVDGTLVSASGGGDRTDVVTGVSVTGATPTGATTPVAGTAYNDDPTSPTRRGDPSAGLFGWKMANLTDSSLTTSTDCQRMAAAELAKGTGVASAINLTAVPMPHLEALDVIDVATDGDRVSTTVSRHMVDSYTLDLSATGDFPVQTRDLGQVIA